MDVDSALLRTLLVLADERHFGRAAARLHISQQALSKRVARLEEKLAAPLVDRSDRRHVRLTALGQDILPLARQVVDATDRITARTTTTTRIRIDIMGDYLAPQRWTRDAARTRHLPIDVVERPPGTTADHLIATGAADFAFGRAGAIPPPRPPYLRHRLILLEPLALLCGTNHPWATRDHVPTRELAGQQLWFPLAAAPIEWRTYLTEFCETFHLDLAATGSTFGYQQWLADIADTPLPPSIVGEAMAPTHPNVRIIPLTDPTPTYPWSLFWRSDTPLQQVHDLLAAIGFPRQPARTPSETWLPASDTATH